MHFSQHELYCTDGHMAHEIAKLLLEHAQDLAERTEAVAAAMRMGMPLREIEEYLDWLDQLNRTKPSGEPSSEDKPRDAQS